MGSLSDKIVEVANDKTRDQPFLFNNGQFVKVKKSVLDDGQTSKLWVNKKCEIINCVRTMISKTNYYRLEHPNGMNDDFEESELDHRFIHKPK